MQNPLIYLEKAYKSALNLSLRYLRRLSKELALLLPLLILLFLAFNLSKPPTQEEKMKTQLLQNPADEETRLNFAVNLLKTNNLELAQTELLKLNSPKAATFLASVNLQKRSPAHIQTEINFWQTIRQNYSNFRDANIKLAILNWKLYRLFEAKKDLNSAQSLDPNNEALQKISKELN